MTFRSSLQTNAPSLGELLSNGRRFRVPAFQRNYSWNQSEWTDLWNDIVALEQSDRDHYLGAIVLQRARDAEDMFEVIDGQQRLTTLSVLLLAIIEEFRSWARAGHEPAGNEERARLYRERFIAHRDARSLMHESKLRLGRADDSFYQSKLVNGPELVIEHRLTTSERCLWQSWNYFRARIKERFGTEHDGGRLADFVDRVVARRLVFIEIVVNDESAAYTVFETLNSRGVSLGTADLLKNYLFARVAGGGPSDLEEMQRLWDELTGIVPLEQVADLIHHYLSSKHEDVSKRDVFRLVRDQIAGSPAAFAFVKELIAAADWYAAFLDPTDPKWAQYPAAREWIRLLALLRAETSRPLALAAAPLLVDRPEELAQMFRIIAIYTLRAHVFLRLNTGDIYRTWNRAAVQVTRAGRVSPKDVAAATRALHGNDDDVRAGFAALTIPASGTRKKLLRFLLAGLERDASGHSLDWETGPFTIEHVRAASDRSRSGREVDRLTGFLERIGNYVPLEDGLNREAADKQLAAKLPIYARSVYALPKSITGEEWNEEAIIQRSNECAKRAVHIWRHDM